MPRRLSSTFAAGTAFVAALVPVFVASPGTAQEPVPAIDSIAPPEPVLAPDVSVVDELIWTAGALEGLLAARDYPSVLLLSALGRAHERHGEASLVGWEPLLARVDPRARSSAAVAACRGSEDGVEGVLCSIEALVPVAPPLVARELAEEGARLVALHGRSGSAVSFATAAPLQSFAEPALERAASLATTFGGTGVATILEGLVGSSPQSGASALLGRATGLSSLLRERGVEIQALASSPLETALAGYEGFLGSVTGSVGRLLDGAAPTSDWASQRSFVYLMSRVAGLAGADADAGARIRAFGNAAADLRGSAAGFADHLATAGRSVAFAALQGNVLAMASGLTSFLQGGGGLGPAAASDVRRIREGMEAMRSEMADRFDSIDAGLDSVLIAVDHRFDRLETIVATYHAGTIREIGALHDEVRALDRRVARLETNLQTYMQAGFDRDYNRTLVLCMEHRQRYLPPFDEIPFPLFTQCLADFRTRAVQDARDALLTDQTTPVDDVSLIAALSDPTLDNLARRLPLLGRVAEQRFGETGLVGGRGLANAVEWSVAAEAYVTLLQEWPGHAQAVSPGDLEAMRSVGLTLRDALVAAPNALTPVTAYYRTRVAELTQEAEVLARRHSQLHLLRVAPGTVLSEIHPMDAAHPPLAVPTAITTHVPQEVRTTRVLALDDVSLVYRLVAEDSVSRENERRRLLVLGKRHDRLTFTRTRVEVELRVASRGTVATYHAQGPFVLRRVEEMAGDPTSDRIVSGREIVPDPVRHFFAEAWPVLAGEASAWRIEPVSPVLVGILGDAIEEELRRYATLALNGVFGSVCQEGATAVELSVDDEASARRIRGALDGLTAARSLLQAYVRLGRGGADGVAHEGAEGRGATLAAALSGPSAILDRTALCEVVSAGESALRLVWLEEEPKRRLEALEATLRADLAPDRGPVAAAAEMPSAPLAIVDETIRALETAMRLQRVRAAASRVAGLP